MGLDQDWHDSFEDRQVDFIGLVDGQYRLEVQALVDGRQSQPLGFDFVVNKPMWKLWWAKVIYLFVAVMIIGLIVKIYNRALQFQVNLLEQRVRTRTLALEQACEREVKLMADKEQLVENVFHQSRTPLQLMLANINEIKSGQLSLSEYIEQQYQCIDTLVRLTELVTTPVALPPVKCLVQPVAMLLKGVAERYQL